MRSTTSIADADEDYESSDSHGYWKKTFASRSKREARWRNVAQKADLKVLKGHTKAVYCVQFVAHGKRLVTGSADKKIKIWDLESATDASSKKAAVTLKGHSGSVKCIHANPNMVFSGSSDHTVRLWCVLSLRQFFLAVYNINVIQSLV
jgi:F-box/WD-40 domain protein 7